MATDKPLLGITALGGQVYVYMRNGERRPVPESELITVIVEWLDRNDLVVKKDGYRVRYGVEEILPLLDESHPTPCFCGRPNVPNVAHRAHQCEEIGVAHG